MKHSITALAAAVILVGGTALAAQQQAPPPATQAKPKVEAATAPASPAGKWVLNLAGPDGQMTIALDVKVDAEKKVTGTLDGPSGASPIAGQVREDGVLEFSFGFDAGGTPMEIWVEGKIDDKGKMAGAMYLGDFGTFPFTAERAKGL